MDTDTVADTGMVVMAEVTDTAMVMAEATVTAMVMVVATVTVTVVRDSYTIEAKKRLQYV